MRSKFYIVPKNAWLLRHGASDSGPNAVENEEDVRQWCLHELLRHYGVRIHDISVEYPVRVARERKANRADIVICRNNKPYVVIECKARGETKHDEAMQQAVNYASLPEVGAEFAVYTNGDKWWVRRWIRREWVEIADIPTFRDGVTSYEWCQILSAVRNVMPILYWLDDPVPGKYAVEYFKALQRFACGMNEITVETDGALLLAADNVLRVLTDVKDCGYNSGKMVTACKALNQYMAKCGGKFEISGSDMWSLAHDASSEVMLFLEGAQGMVSLDHRLTRVIQVLLAYINDQAHRPGRYTDITGVMQAEIRNYIDLALTIRFEARLPDTIDSLSVGDIKRYCKPSWEHFLKGDPLW